MDKIPYGFSVLQMYGVDRVMYGVDRVMYGVDNGYVRCG